MNIPFSIVAGSIMFHVRRRPADYHPRKRKKKIQQKWNQGSSSELMEYRYEEGFDRLPFFLELNPGELKSKRANYTLTNIRGYPCMLVKNDLYDCLGNFPGMSLEGRCVILQLILRHAFYISINIPVEFLSP